LPHAFKVGVPQRDDIDARLRTRLNTVNNRKRDATARSDVTDLLDKVVELLLGVGVFLGHLFVLGFPLVAGLLEGLDFAFVVARLDVGLAEPGGDVSVGADQGSEMVDSRREQR
jgi:hypothetical protein